MTESPPSPSPSPPQSPPLLLPLSEPPPRWKPHLSLTLTYAIVAANVAVWLLTVALGASPFSPTAQWLLEHGGNLGARTLDGEQWRLFTSMFLHSGVLHLGMNMLGLHGGGRLVERLFGRLGFGAIYLVAGLAGSLATALRPGPGVVSVGASGAIFGVLGAAGAYYALHRDRMDQNTAREAGGLLLCIGFNVIYGLQLPGIDMLAHLGGLAGGFLCALALEYRRTGAGAPSPRRAVIVGAIGLAAVLAGAFAAPVPMREERAAFDALAVTEQRVGARWTELLGQRDRQAITDEQLAAAIDQDVLAPWRAAGAAFRQSGAGGQLRDALLEYVQARQEGWELVSSGLRVHDRAAVDRGLARLKEAAERAQQALRKKDGD
jgi:membrane associated rhomboid family serine protease